MWKQKRIDALHQSQAKAYREAAIKAIKEWAAAFPLQPMEDGDSEQAFVDRCVSALVFDPSPKGGGQHTWPNWKLENAKAIANLEVRKRARAIFEKYHPSKDQDEENKENDDKDATEEGEDTEESGDEESGGNDMEGKDGEEEDGQDNGTKPKLQQPPNHGAIKAKGNGGSNNKATPQRKKGTAIKISRKCQSARGRKRGRGGGGANAKKSNA